MVVISLLGCNELRLGELEQKPLAAKLTLYIYIYIGVCQQPVIFCTSNTDCEASSKRTSQEPSPHTGRMRRSRPKMPGTWLALIHLNVTLRTNIGIDQHSVRSGPTLCCSARHEGVCQHETAPLMFPTLTTVNLGSITQSVIRGCLCYTRLPLLCHESDQSQVLIARLV
jgi:hypothetical protein